MLAQSMNMDLSIFYPLKTSTIFKCYIHIYIIAIYIYKIYIWLFLYIYINRNSHVLLNFFIHSFSYCKLIANSHLTYNKLDETKHNTVSFWTWWTNFLQEKLRRRKRSRHIFHIISCWKGLLVLPMLRRDPLNYLWQSKITWNYIFLQWCLAKADMADWRKRKLWVVFALCIILPATAVSLVWVERRSYTMFLSDYTALTVNITDF